MKRIVFVLSMLLLLVVGASGVAHAPPATHLGVPHVVTNSPHTGTPGSVESLSCPSGESALSFVWTAVGTGAGGFSGASVTPPQVRPLTTNGVPTGYEWYEVGSVQNQEFVTCSLPS